MPSCESYLSALFFSRSLHFIMQHTVQQRDDGVKLSLSNSNPSSSSLLIIIIIILSIISGRLGESAYPTTSYNMLLSHLLHDVVHVHTTYSLLTSVMYCVFYFILCNAVIGIDTISNLDSQQIRFNASLYF